MADQRDAIESAGDTTSSAPARFGSMSVQDPTRLPVQARVSELILEHARDYAIFTMTRDGCITSWSHGATRVTGYSEDEAIGMDFEDLFTASDRAAGQARLELTKAWGEGRAEDTRWHVRKGGERFWANGVTNAFDDGATQGLIKVMRDETRNRLADEQRILLLNELNHRINNTLVTVQSMVEQSLRAADLDRALRDNLTARIVALAEAHKLLVTENWAGADLQPIVEGALAPFLQPGEARLEVDGPAVRLSPQQALSMALVLHELTTNAVKYGALSLGDGRISVAWNLHYDEQGSRHLTFLWEERGGPPVTAPKRRGFGSRLIARSFDDIPGGKARVEYADGGVRCTIDLPLVTAAETIMMDLTQLDATA